MIDAPAAAPAGNAAARGVRAAAWRFVLQRASAAVLAVCVVVHLATIILAVRHGLTSEAIVARMHASLVWPLFYAIFVVAVTIHAPLGLRTIADEWLGWRGRATDAVLTVFALVLLGGGLHAVRALA
ncbi:MAG TPA: succinate dehydrogenase [Casimicrobiaceae bacterium]